MDQDQGSGDRLWTVADAANYLQLKPATVRSMVRAGRLPAITDGKRLIRFDQNDIKTKWGRRRR